MSPQSRLGSPMSLHGTVLGSRVAPGRDRQAHPCEILCKGRMWVWGFVLEASLLFFYPPQPWGEVDTSPSQGHPREVPAQSHPNATKLPLLHQADLAKVSPLTQHKRWDSQPSQSWGMLLPRLQAERR